MLNLTRILFGTEQPADHLRYGHGHGAAKTAAVRKPVVVWNITRTCNLRCVHCYSNSDAQSYPGELSWDQCTAVIDDLANFKVPALLLSGGEPMIHPRFFDLADYATSKGLRITVSTNGTMITPDAASRLKQLGVSYVGISLDGIGENHDLFRGKKGAFDKAVAAFRNCRAAQQKVGLRLTLTKQNMDDLTRILDFIEQESIDRVCFYHLVYSGRGADVAELDPGKARAALDEIIDRCLDWHSRGIHREVLTVDQPADAVYLLKRIHRTLPDRLSEAWKLLTWNGGGQFSSGTGISNIDTQGNVHPDQFWQDHTLGNVKERPFSEIWSTPDDPILSGLRNRLALLKGRCGTCAWKNICGGGFRVRAWQKFGDPWAEDPGCYLSDEEIAEALSPSEI